MRNKFSKGRPVAGVKTVATWVEARIWASQRSWGPRHIFGSTIDHTKTLDLPPTLAASRSASPGKGTLLLGRDRAGCAQVGGRVEAGAKAIGAGTERCLLLHKGAVGPRSPARAGVTGGNTAPCLFTASRAQCWQAAPLWLPWEHCYCTSGSPPATGSTQGAWPGLPTCPQAPPGSCRSCPPSRYRWGCSSRSPVPSWARPRLCFWVSFALITSTGSVSPLRAGRAVQVSGRPGAWRAQGQPGAVRVAGGRTSTGRGCQPDTGERRAFAGSRPLPCPGRTCVWFPSRSSGCSEEEG